MANYKYQSLSFIALLFFIAPLFVACNDDDDEEELVGNWVELSSLDGPARSDAVSFIIGNIAYIGTGYDGYEETRLTDFWKYDPEKNSWKKIAPFPGEARNSAVAFSTETKGYVGTGYDGDNKLKDFWEYDPEADQWKQIADFGGTARYGATAFSVNNKGYVSCGYDGTNQKDCWEYNPEIDTWTQKSSIGGQKRKDAAGFMLNNKGYIVGGVNNGSYLTDFWQYDPSTDTWAELNLIYNTDDYSFDDDYADITGSNKTVFTINGKAYLVGGSSTLNGIVWEWTPETDRWEEKTSLEGSARIDAVGFSIANRGYITTGRSSSYYLDDLWGFDPDAEQVDND